MHLILLLLLPLCVFASERIITLAPSLSEIVFALGKGDELVGVSEFSSWPEEVKEITKVGGYSNPSLERVLSLNPTLVIGQGKYMHTISQIKELDVKTLSFELDTIESIKSAIQKIAQELHSDASPLISPIDEAVKQVKEDKRLGSALKGKKVLIIYGLSLDMNRGMYIAGHNIFYEEIIQLAGAQNAFQGEFPGQPVIHYEALLQLNPDIVILIHQEGTDGKIDTEKAKALWYTVPINASKNKRIHIMQKSYLSIPSHRISKTIREIAEVIAQ